MTNENNPGIRLIDANALLRQDDPTYDEEGFRVWYATDINRAPTITPTFQLKDITDEDVARFAMIWQRATSKGLILEPERPQGKWLNCNDPLYSGGGYTVCSNCEMRFSFGAYHETFDFKYCPECGAKMHGGAL